MLAHNKTGWSGLACRACGCKRLSVYYTRPRSSGQVRVRICDNCGRRVATFERELPEDAEPLPPAPVERPRLQPVEPALSRPCRKFHRQNSRKKS